jgi:hypothetical protein
MPKKGLGAARLVSTPSVAFPLRLGSGLPVKASPNLSSSTLRVSPKALKFGLSPLRLPIPPRPHKPAFLIETRYHRVECDSKACLVLFGLSTLLPCFLTLGALLLRTLIADASSMFLICEA